MLLAHRAGRTARGAFYHPSNVINEAVHRMLGELAHRRYQFAGPSGDY